MQTGSDGVLSVPVGNSQAVVLTQMVSEKAGKRVVAHHHLYLTQQRQLRGHRIPKSNGRGCVRLTSWYHPTSQHVTQRVNKYQAFAALDQLTSIEAHGLPRRGSRVFDALRINYHAGGLRFFCTFSRYSTTRQAFISSSTPFCCHLLKYQYSYAISKT